MRIIYYSLSNDILTFAICRKNKQAAAESQEDDADGAADNHSNDEAVVRNPSVLSRMWLCVVQLELWRIQIPVIIQTLPVFFFFCFFSFLMCYMFALCLFSLRTWTLMPQTTYRKESPPQWVFIHLFYLCVLEMHIIALLLWLQLWTMAVNCVC